MTIARRPKSNDSYAHRQAEALDALQAGLKPKGRSVLARLHIVADPDIDVAADLRTLRK